MNPRLTRYSLFELGFDARMQKIIQGAISTVYLNYSTVQRYFPRCDVAGSYAPAWFRHLSLAGAVPAKCRECDHIVEGQCTRVRGNLIDLDHGPCPMEGSSMPASYQVKGVWTFVPAKCSTCQHLVLNRIGTLVCTYDQERWGDWEPGRVSSHSAS